MSYRSVLPTPTQTAEGAWLGPGDITPPDFDAEANAVLIEAGALVVAEVAAALEDLTRDELNARAAALGIEDPQALSNKPAVIAAIQAQEATS